VNKRKRKALRAGLFMSDLKVRPPKETDGKAEAKQIPRRPQDGLAWDDRCLP